MQILLGSQEAGVLGSSKAWMLSSINLLKASKPSGFPAKLVIFSERIYVKP